MPGTVVTTDVRSGPSGRDSSPSSTFFIAGITERGRADEAVFVRSMAEFESEFGGRVSYGYAHDAVRAYFEEGGDKAYVVRVVGGDATIGERTLVDRAGVPLSTLKIIARGPGAWSGDLTVEVLAGTVDGTFKIRLVYGSLVESYDNLSTPAEAASEITQRSQWVTAVDMGSATAAPDNQPAILAATALSVGTDDRGTIVAADYVTALDTYAGYDLGAGAVAVPGQAASALEDLATHGATNNRIVLLAPAAATSVADAIALAQDLKGAVDNPEGVGLFYPWVKVPDGSNVPGATRLISPEGYVAGARARVHASDGPWAAAAGIAAQSRYIVGVERELTRTEGDQLDASEVNAIRTIAGTTRVYGWRSVSADETNYFLLSGRDFLNYLVTEGERRLEQFVFRTIDGRGHLLSDIKNELVGMLEPLRSRGGLYELFNSYGERVDPGYSVDVGPSVNPLSQLAQNTVAAEIGARFSPTGALVKLLITKAGLTATL